VVSKLASTYIWKRDIQFDNLIWKRNMRIVQYISLMVRLHLSLEQAQCIFRFMLLISSDYNYHIIFKYY